MALSTSRLRPGLFLTIFGPPSKLNLRDPGDSTFRNLELGSFLPVWKFPNNFYPERKEQKICIYKLSPEKYKVSLDLLFQLVPSTNQADNVLQQFSFQCRVVVNVLDTCHGFNLNSYIGSPCLVTFSLFYFSQICP